jgi:hypothetical protein
MKKQPREVFHWHYTLIFFSGVVMGVWLSFMLLQALK